MKLQVSSQEIQVEQMSDSARLAFCTQQRRVAKTLKFVE